MKTTCAYLFSAALAVLAGPAVAQTKVTLVQSHVNIAVGEEVFLYAVPKALGYFAKEGLEVTIQGAAGGVQAGQVMQSGNAQFITTLAEGVLQMREQGANAIAILSLKVFNGYAVATPQGSPIKKLEDLVGKTVGFPVAGGGTHMIMDESLRALGKEPTMNRVVIGAGPSAAAAIDGKRVDAAMLWDAAFGALENLGMKLDYIDMPIQDKLAGYTLSSNDKFIAENPKAVEGFCRSVLKGLHFTMLNKEAAIKIFYKEFPTVVPAGVDEATAIRQGVNVLNKWLSYAMKGVPVGSTYGEFSAPKWEFMKELYTKAGSLKGTVPATSGFTSQFTKGCNDFDRAEIAAAAAAAK
jgi:NitT/TauT family transport system substrate-binding protein